MRLFKVFPLVVLLGLAIALSGQTPLTIPYDQDFTTEFSNSSMFYPGWLRNSMDRVTRYYEDGNYSMKMLPVGEEIPTFAQVRLNLTGKQNAYVGFWVATLKNGGEEDLKKTRLSVSLSTNGGASFSFGMKIGGEQGFDNQDMSFQYFLYPLPPTAFNNSQVVVRFNVKSGGGPHLPAIVLIDDVHIATEPTDIFAPFIWGEVNPTNYNTIELYFSEPLLSSNARDKNNYTFTWPEEGGLNPPGSATLPKVQRVSLLDGGYTVRLALNPRLTQGAYYTLNVENICDLHGNCTNFELEVVRNIIPEGTLVISEVLFADPGTAHPKEKLQFVEVYNATSAPVPVGGLRIKGAISAHNMPNIKIPAGGYHVITRNDETFLATFGFPAWEWKGSWIEYASEEEGEPLDVQELYIQTTDHHDSPYVDHMIFDLNQPDWDALNVLGYSIEKVCLDADPSLPSSWALANGLGTPPNFSYTFEGETYTITATPGDPRAGTSPCGGSPGVAGRVALATPTVAITPNPFDHSTWIATNSDFGAIIRIELRDLSGRLMQTHDGLNTHSFELEAAGITPGMYLLYIWGEDTCELQKLIIQ
ncbi:MAG: lamin tail domain-containing protein [Saprospirales bacterium]|nr:lamin tail domain-containing protein [Saprospirales bacterium]